MKIANRPNPVEKDLNLQIRSFRFKSKFIRVWKLQSNNLFTILVIIKLIKLLRKWHWCPCDYIYISSSTSDSFEFVKSYNLVDQNKIPIILNLNLK